jgi:UDP-N-acetyl-2-amino-2-deoxyglucuronate dehydrogenase
MAHHINFALVGCGGIAPTHARALKALPEDARLVACCDTVAERADRFAAEYGLRIAPFEELLRDSSIDALTFCTPSGLHATLASTALRAGKHVVVEKPMDVSAAACDALLGAQRENGCKLAVISQHRFDPASQLVHAALQRGELGRLVAVDMRVPWYRKQEYYDSGDWRGTWELDGGGCLMNQGVHTVDLMLWLAGPVAKVYCEMRTAAHERIEVEDQICGTLVFENGAIGTLFASTACYPGFPARLALHGTEGSAVIEGDELQLLAIRGREALHGRSAHAHAVQVASGGTKAATANATPLDTPAAEAWAWGDAHRAQFLDFIRAVRDDRAPLVDGVAGRAAVVFIEAAYRSARTGQPVQL